MLLPALTCLHNVCTLSIYLSLSHCTLNAAAALIKPNVIQNTQLQPVVVEMTILHRNTHASRKVSMISALSAQIMLARCARQGHAPAHPSDPTCCQRIAHSLPTTSAAGTSDPYCSFAFGVQVRYAQVGMHRDCRPGSLDSVPRRSDNDTIGVW